MTTGHESIDHHIFIGQTKAGKTTAATRLAHWYDAHGVKSLVLDRMMDERWPSSAHIVRDADEFLAIAQNPDKCLQCALFIDDAGGSVNKHLDCFNWVTTESRHFGHVAHLCTQRAVQIAPTVRSQCGVLYVFNVNQKDAKSYAEDFNCAEILKAPSLPKGHCLRVERFKPVRYLRLW